MEKKLGKCPCCNKSVYDNQLYVEENTNVYHFSCYNYMKADEKYECEKDRRDFSG